MPNDPKPNPIDVLLSQIRVKLLESSADGEKIPSSIEDLHLFLKKQGNPLSDISPELRAFDNEAMSKLELNDTALLEGPEGMTVCRRVPGGWIYSMLYNNTSVFVSKFN